MENARGAAAEEPMNSREPERERIIDIHAHVVFGLDDGSADLEMSLEMLRRQVEQGVTDVICTSHSWGKWQNYEKNLEALRAAAGAEGLKVDLWTGCEVACSRGIFDEVLGWLNGVSRPPLAKSGLMLMEFLPDIPAEELVSCLKDVANRTEYTPVIAHAERYAILHEDENAYREIASLGLPIQMNAYSLFEEKDEKIRELAKRLLEDRLVTFIGSDAHGAVRRPPCIRNGIAYIREHCGSDYAEAICWRNAQRYLLEGKA